MERDWNVVIVEGPGQAGFLRFHPDVAFPALYAFRSAIAMGCWS
jgi:hypothetical protein